MLIFPFHGLSRRDLDYKRPPSALTTKDTGPVQVRMESSQDSASRDGAVSPPERSGVQSKAIRVQVAEFLQDELERLARVVKQSGYD